MTSQANLAAHPDIPPDLHRLIFPLYNPSTVDIIVFWELPAQKRAGHILLQGPNLGTQHAALKEIIGAAEIMKVKRSMYAETHRERQATLEAVRKCEWNQEADPVAVFVHDGSVVEHDFRQGCVSFLHFITVVMQLDCIYCVPDHAMSPSPSLSGICH